MRLSPAFHMNSRAAGSSCGLLFRHAALSWALLFTVSISLTAGNSALRFDAPKLLRYRYTPGQVDRYSVDVRVKVDSAERIPDLSARTIRGAGSTIVKVEKVNPDRSARLRVEVAPLRMAGSRPDPALVPQIVTLNLSARGEGPTGKLARGKALSARDLFIDPSALSRLGAVLPARPVKPGDRWSSSAPNPFQASGTVVVTSRYFADDRVRNISTVRIHQTMAIPIGIRLVSPSGGETVKAHGALKVNSAVQFAPSLGKVIRTSSLGSGKIRLTPASDKAGKESVTLTMNVDAVSELSLNN